MKQIRNRFLLPVVLLMVAASLAGCTKSDSTPNNPDAVVIAPLAYLGTSVVEAGSGAYSPSTQSSLQSSLGSRSVASGDQELSLFFARADETSASTYAPYSAAALTATRAAGTGNKPLTFSPVQHYLTNRLRTKLTGWYPSGAYDGTSRTVSWTIDGQQDVMTAPMQQGSWESAMPTMTFDHRLTQLQFYPYAHNELTTESWGKITKIEVLNQPNTVVYDLANDATGAVSFSGDQNKTSNFSAGIAVGGVAIASSKSTAKRVGDAVMIAPSTSITLRISTEKRGVKDIVITQKFEQGVPYRLYFNFVQFEMIITPEIEVSEWVNGGSQDVTTGEEFDLSIDGSSSFLLSSAHMLNPIDGSDYMNWYVANGILEATLNPTGAKACPDGWRVPTQAELLLLMIYTSAIPDKFVMPLNSYWSTLERDANNAWRVAVGYDINNLYATNTFYFEKTSLHSVRCVRDSKSTATSAPKVVVDGSGRIIIDSRSVHPEGSTRVKKATTTAWIDNNSPESIGLNDIASTKSNEQAYYYFEVAKSNSNNNSIINWLGAINYCATLTTDGGGWRAPVMRELTLMRLLRTELESQPGFAPFLNHAYFSASQGHAILDCWYVNFNDYEVWGCMKADMFMSRCVRDLVPTN